MKLVTFSLIKPVGVDEDLKESVIRVGPNSPRSSSHLYLLKTLSLWRQARDWKVFKHFAFLKALSYTALLRF